MNGPLCPGEHGGHCCLGDDQTTFTLTSDSAARQEISAVQRRKMSFGFRWNPALLDMLSNEDCFNVRFFRRCWVTFDRSMNIKETCWNLQNIRVNKHTLSLTTQTYWWTRITFLLHAAQRLRTVSGGQQRPVSPCSQRQRADSPQTGGEERHPSVGPTRPQSGPEGGAVAQTGTVSDVTFLSCVHKY